jgi:hypothetical protein
MTPTTDTPNLDSTPEASSSTTSSSSSIARPYAADPYAGTPYAGRSSAGYPSDGYARGSTPSGGYDASGGAYAPGAAASPYPGTTMAGQPEPKPLSLTSFWLGIASVIFSFTLFVPVAAIVLGFLARTREPGGRVYAIWGIVLGFVMAVGWALALIAAGGLALAALPFIAVI